MNDMEKMIADQQEVFSKIAASSRASETEITKALTFSIDDKIYGIELPYVREILGVPHITLVPAVPYYIMGIINVRSKVVPIVSMRRRFDLEEKPFDEKTCTIIINYGSYSVGVIVDEVLDVLSVQKKHQAEIPALERVNSNKFIQYILEMQDGVKLILDIKKLIFDQEMAAEEIDG